MLFHLHGGTLEAAVAQSKSGDFPEIHLSFLPGAEAAKYIHFNAVGEKG